MSGVRADLSLAELRALPARLSHEVERVQQKLRSVGTDSLHLAEIDLCWEAAAEVRAGRGARGGEGKGCECGGEGRGGGVRGAQSEATVELAREGRKRAEEVSSQLSPLEGAVAGPLRAAGRVVEALGAVEAVQDVLGAPEVVDGCAAEGQLGKAVDVRDAVQRLVRRGGGRLQRRLAWETHARLEQALGNLEAAQSSGPVVPRAVLASSSLRLRLLRQRMREERERSTWSAEEEDAVVLSATRAALLRSIPAGSGAEGLQRVYVAAYLQGRRESEALAAANDLVAWSHRTWAVAGDAAERRVRADPTSALTVARSLRGSGLERRILRAGASAGAQLLSRGLQNALRSLPAKFVAWLGAPRLPMSSSDASAALVAATPLAWALNAFILLLLHFKPLWPLLPRTIATRSAHYAEQLRSIALAHHSSLPPSEQIPFLLALLHALQRISDAANATLPTPLLSLHIHSP